MSDLVCRVQSHARGTTLVAYDSKRRLVTCGNDGEVVIYHNIHDEEPSNFELSTSCVSAMVCYLADGVDVIAMAMDDNTVQAFSADGSPKSLLMRFTAPVTSLAVTKDHTHLAAGSSEFIIKVLELDCLPSSSSLVGHEAPILSVTFNPTGNLLASSSCDGTVRVWSVGKHECMKTLSILPKTSDVTLTKSLCQLSWEPSGNLLAIPVGSEVKVYKGSSWTCVCTLSDGNYHKEVLNVVRWSPCGGYMACGDKAGSISVWHVTTRTLKLKMRNENQTGITALEWDPRGHQLVFGDVGGYVGVFDQACPSENLTNENADHLIEDSLLMEGIPADDIFDDDFDIINGEIANNEVGMVDVGGVRALKRKQLNSDESDDQSNLSDLSLRNHDDEGAISERIKPGSKFSEKLMEVYQESWQPSATPTHLQHRFMVYNLVGVVCCHDDNETPLIEVDFHNSSIHHSFSLPNSLGHTMAALSEEALVLAAERRNGVEKSHLQCVHFSSWDSHKDWSIPLPGNESITAIVIGNGWITIATDKQFLRLFTIGGIQREVISVPGHVITLAAWGPCLAVVYQTLPCTANVFTLTVWVLDVQKKKQLHPPHALPLSHHSTLRWIGFSEEGCLVTHDSKGMVHIHGNSCYGGLSWIPVLDTNKKLGNKSDHYFIVGMTHQPDELRGILCKGLEYPPVQPRPVMSTLPFQMPMCEEELERTEHEREYLEAFFIRPPGQPRTPSELVQKLMKMFAFSCKSGREFKACEIAGMMPDEQSINLAMTYASRSHHIHLARQISELIQKKSLDVGDSEASDEDDLIGGGWTNQNSQTYEPEAQYARTRNNLLKKGPSSLKSTNQIHRRVATKSKNNSESSKLSRYMNEVKRGKFIHTSAGGDHTHSAPSRSRYEEVPDNHGNHSNHGNDEVLSHAYMNDEGRGGDGGGGGRDETAELFSDSEGEHPGDAESAVVTHDNSNEASLGEDEEEVGLMENSPRAFGDNSLRKRSNPFKLSTPVSKRIVAERKSGFLDNITAQVNKDNRRKEIKKTQRDKTLLGGVASKGGGGVKRKRATSAPQKSLKSSFFKRKLDHSETTPLHEEVSKDTQLLVDNGQSHDLTEEPCDQETISNSGTEGHSNRKMTI